MELPQQHLRTVAVCIALIANVCPRWASANGKFYVRERIPPNIPYQRAVIVYYEGRELLVLQSKFEGDPAELGWVVPVPSPPRLASMKADPAHRLFTRLTVGTGVRSVHVNQVLLLAVVILSLLSAVLWAVVYPRVKDQLRGPLKGLEPARVFAYSCCLLVPSGVLLWASLGSRGHSTVLDERQVGIYDTKVLGADSSKELIEWLNQQGFRSGLQDEAAFKSYVDRGWCFVTARVHATDEVARDSGPEDTMAEPLVLLFETNEIVYPLALTGTLGKETELLLYVFGDQRVSAGERLTTAWADTWDASYVFRHLETEPRGLFQNLGTMFANSPFLTKFRGRLKPQDMTTDLTFEQIGHEPHRGTVVEFW